MLFRKQITHVKPNVRNQIFFFFKSLLKDIFSSSMVDKKQIWCVLIHILMITVKGLCNFQRISSFMLFKEETIHEKPYVRNQVFIYFFFSNHSTILNSFVFHGWENADLMCYYQDSHHFRQRIDKFSEEPFALRFTEETIHGNLYVRNQLFIIFFFNLVLNAIILVFRGWLKADLMCCHTSHGYR